MPRNPIDEAIEELIRAENQRIDRQGFHYVNYANAAPLQYINYAALPEPPRPKKVKIKRDEGVKMDWSIWIEYDPEDDYVHDRHVYVKVITNNAQVKNGWADEDIDWNEVVEYQERYE